MNNKPTIDAKLEVAKLGLAPFRFVKATTAAYRACAGAPSQPGTCCDFCGTGIKNVFWFVGNAPGDTQFKLGVNCAEKVGLKYVMRDGIAAQRRADNAAEYKARAERKAQRDAAERAATPWLMGVALASLGADKYTAGRIQRLIASAGVVSSEDAAEIFADAMMSQWRTAVRTEAQPVPVTTNRVSIAGRVLHIKAQDGYAYGTTDYKMLIETADGYKLWGSVPSKLLSAIEKYDYVQFSAKVEQSDRDASFGFYKRPTKARIAKWSPAS